MDMPMFHKDIDSIYGAMSQQDRICHESALADAINAFSGSESPHLNSKIESAVLAYRGRFEEIKARLDRKRQAPEP